MKINQESFGSATFFTQYQLLTILLLQKQINTYKPSLQALKLVWNYYWATERCRYRPHLVAKKTFDFITECFIEHGKNEYFQACSIRKYSVGSISSSQIESRDSAALNFVLSSPLAQPVFSFLNFNFNFSIPAVLCSIGSRDEDSVNLALSSPLPWPRIWPSPHWSPDS